MKEVIDGREITVTTEVPEEYEITEEEIQARIREDARAKIHRSKSRAIYAKLFSEIEKYDVSVDELYINEVTYRNFRGWTRCDFNPETKRKYLKVGYLGEIWNANVIIDKTLPDNVIKVESTSDKDIKPLPEEE